jgi:hypothetical protein
MAAQNGSGKLSCSHPIDPLGDHNLSVLTTAYVTAKNPLASLPAHLLPVRQTGVIWVGVTSARRVRF